MPSRVRGFVFTLNNYNEEEFQELLCTAQAHSKYYIFGKEIAPTTGTPHIQGYIYWKNGKTIEASRKMLPTRVANHVVAKGSPKQNYVYCSKEGNYQTNMNYEGEKLVSREPCQVGCFNSKWRHCELCEPPEFGLIDATELGSGDGYDTEDE